MQCFNARRLKKQSGPWTVGTDDDTPDIIVEDENGYIISEVRNDGDDKPEQRANAHLIAAAPAMYEALVEMVELRKQLAIDHPHLFVGKAVLLRAEAALAQAEGKP